MEPYWVRCGHCGAHSSRVTSTQLYLTSCGHFSCNHCLLAAPIPKPPTSGYCYDCNKPCAVVNLSHKHKLSPDVSFYFQDPGPLLQKMVDVYNFQKVHRQRKYEYDLKNRLLQDIAAVRSIREKAEPYLQLYGKAYEALYKEYGVKPLTQKCDFSSAEMDSFIAEVTRIKQELDRMGGVSRLGEVRTPSVPGADASMTTPTMTPVQTDEGGSSMFRARVQSEMRSGGARNTGGNMSQCSTPAGSVCSKPSPLLTDKRASLPRTTPGSGGGVRTTPGRGVRTTPNTTGGSLSLTSSHPVNRSLHLSTLQTPSPSGNWSNDQRLIQNSSTSSRLSPSSVRRPHLFQGPCLSSTPLDSRMPGYPRGSVNSSRMSVSRVSMPRDQPSANSAANNSMRGQRKSSPSPQHSQRQRTGSCSPMSIGGTPVSMMSLSRLPHRASSPTGNTGQILAASRPSGKGITSPQVTASGLVPTGKLPLSSCRYGNDSNPQRRSRESVVPSSQTIGLHSVPRKPLSGVSTPVACPRQLFGSQQRFKY